jgi:hypothetical protein
MMMRWLSVAALSILSSTWAMAQVPAAPPSEYTIQLTDWDSFQEFDFTPNVDIPPGFTNNPCFPVGDICGDPSIGLLKGGDATDEDGSFSFSSGPTGSNSSSFINTGTPITSVEISTTLSPDEQGALFSCFSNIFQDCTFVVTDPPNVDMIDTYFWDPYVPGGIPTEVPEPSQEILVLLGFAGVIVARARKGSVSSFLARTPR